MRQVWTLGARFWASAHLRAVNSDFAAYCWRRRPKHSRKHILVKRAVPALSTDNSWKSLCAVYRSLSLRLKGPGRDKSDKQRKTVNGERRSATSSV